MHKFTNLQISQTDPFALRTHHALYIDIHTHTYTNTYKHAYTYIYLYTHV